MRIIANLRNPWSCYDLKQGVHFYHTECLLEEPHSTILSSGNIYNTTCKRIFWPDYNKTTLDFFLTLPITNKCLYNTINGRWGNQDFTPWATLSLWYTLSTRENTPSGQHWKEMLPLVRTGRKCSL